MSDTQSLYQSNGILEVTVADYPIYARVITDHKDYCYPCKSLEVCGEHRYACEHAHGTHKNQWPCVYNEDAKAMACARRVLVLEGEDEST